MNKKLILAAAIPFLLASCSNDDDDNNGGGTQMGSTTLRLDIQNLEALSTTERYEGWLVVNGTPISTGLFEVSANGDLSQTDFTVGEADLAAATDFVLSIEPYPDTDPLPSDIKILGGSFNGGTMTNVGVSHPAALGDDFSTASGKYIFATPTTNDTTDELSGVWFLDLSSGSPAVGLNLPTLASNWQYEGWVVVNGTPVSTGTFTMNTGSDNFGGFSGMDSPAPPFPGEDFVANAPSGMSFPLDLSGAPIVISIEPNPDNSPMPFAFKPLFHEAPANALDHVTYDLDNQIQTNFPSGSASKL